MFSNLHDAMNEREKVREKERRIIYNKEVFRPEKKKKKPFLVIR